MIITLDRGANRYKEIEEFTDYELTQCIAYEMAVRNQKNIDRIDRVVDFYKKYKEDINYYVNLTGMKNNSTRGRMPLNILHDLILDIEVVNFDYRRGALSHVDSENISNEFYEVIDSITGGIGTAFAKHDEAYTSKGATDIERVHESNGYRVKTTVKTMDYKVIAEGKEQKVFGYKTNITEKFKRPRVKLNEATSKIVKIELDINRPLDELLAYITHIKQDIDKNKKVLKAPIELFGEELQKADDVSRMCTETKNGKEICFDGRKGITRTQKLADMFFIYDAVKQGAKELWIRTALSEYYETIGKITDMSDKTFRKYRDIAIDYIENERYKELITGVKS